MLNLEKAIGKTLNTLAFLSPNTAGKLCLNLFCRPQIGRKFSSKDIAFLKKAEWTSLWHNGEKIQCYTWGKGSKKILLAHGFNSNAARWRLLANYLKNTDYQIIALDVPAHGHSGWNRVNGLLYAQVLAVVLQYFRPDYLIAHSFGGTASTYYLSHQAKFLPKKVILMGVPNRLKDITELYFRQLNLNSGVQSAYFNAFQTKFGYAVDYFELAEMAKNINIPALIIHDEQDDICSYVGAKELHQNWKNAAFLGTQNLGHSLQGKVVFKAILDFLKAK